MDTPNLKIIALIALMLTIGVFSLTFLVGSGLQESSMKSMDLQLREINTKMMDSENIFLLAEINKDSCYFLERQLLVLDEDLSEIAGRAIAMEHDFKTQTKEYETLKSSIIATRIRYWLFAEKTRMLCNKNITTILYFYTTSRECRDCFDQGLILDYINKKTGNMLIISPIDKEEDLDTVRVLRESYNITEAPSMIVDNQVVFRGLTQEKEIVEYVCNKTHITGLCV